MVRKDETQWAELCAQLDWNAVRDVQRETRGLAEYDFQSLSVMTVAAARRWALGDLGKIGGIEHRVLVTIPENEELGAQRWPVADKQQEQKLLRDGARVFKGFLDLVLEAESGTPVIADWKTTGDCGPAWRERVRHSWQGKLYCWAYGAERVIFRGVQRDGRTAEVVVDWPVETATGYVAFGDSDAEQYVRNAFAIRESQRGTQWARSMPHACGAFGRTCERWDHCNENTAPAGGVGNLPLSHSTIETLLLCPERYRLSRLLADDDGDDDKRTAIGRAFHAGVEQLYTQLRRL